YLGNSMMFLANARVGANCLLGTKVMLPIDGPVRENIGLLGSPCFEIPRVVERDRRIPATDEERRALLRKKDRSNLATIALLLLALWIYPSCILPVLCLTFLHFPTQGVASLLAGLVVIWGFSILYWVLVERAGLGFGRLRSSVVSMYDDY